MTTVTVLHPGAMGSAVAAQVGTTEHEVLWVEADRSNRTAQRAEAAGLTKCESLGDALRRSDVVLSICPPHAAEEVAAEVARHPFNGVYVDANAISPHRMQRIAHGICPTPAVVDGAIFGPPPVNGRSCRLYLSGRPQETAAVHDLFRGTTVDVRETGEEGVGSASALKASFAAFQKAARTLAGISHALADAHGVADLLTAEAEVMTSEILSDPEYLPSVAARAWRWAPEMLEIADTLKVAGLPADLAEAAAHVMSRWEGDKDQYLPVSEVLAHLQTSS